MNICVVGGTGNISRPMVELLIAHGHRVSVFNRNSSGGVPEGARLIIGDRKDRDTFEEQMQAENFDAAIDMICFGREDALSDLRAFRGVSHFVQVSTVCTYGIDYDFMPVTEDHPLRPISDYGRNKVEADAAFMEAYCRDGFPVTIIKPSTTYGAKMGLLRQIAWEFSWINRVETGRPLLILGEGTTLHQFLHVEDAAIAFAHLIGRRRCIGQTYNLVDRGFRTWKEWHETAMAVIGTKVELVGITLAQMERFDIPNRAICGEIFAHNCYYSNAKLLRDVPEFAPRLSLAEGMAQVYHSMKTDNRIPLSQTDGWEDGVIARLNVD